MPYLDENCNADQRLGALHVEGLSDLWVNIYLEFAIAFDSKNHGDQETIDYLVYPDNNTGLEGVR